MFVNLSRVSNNQVGLLRYFGVLTCTGMSFFCLTSGSDGKGLKNLCGCKGTTKNRDTQIKLKKNATAPQVNNKNGTKCGMTIGVIDKIKPASATPAFSIGRAGRHVWIDG